MPVKVAPAVPVTSQTPKDAAAVPRATPASTVRRSIRSESRPIGHCSSRPPKMPAAMNVEVWVRVKPVPWANTGASPWKFVLTTPAAVAPISPSGETFHRSSMLVRSGGEGFGALARVSSTGTRASE